MAYTVVGGAAVALHGVPELVDDLDLDVGVEDAYRCESLFEAETLEPVAWREGEQYRSHFGRFDVDGVTVEVMGDLHRREDDTWVAASPTTAVMVDLEDVPVRVVTLEEETLAYLQRGRLDRAARCLRQCDPERLLALMSR